VSEQRASLISSFLEEAQDAHYPAEYISTVQAALADLQHGAVYSISAERNYELIYVQGRVWGACSSGSVVFKQKPEGDLWFEQVCHRTHVLGAFTDYKIASG
jgi:hypothetical protein